MRVLHLIGGGDVGGAKTHVITLVSRLASYCDIKLVSFREGAFAQDCRKAGIDISIVNSRSLIKECRELRRIADAFRPDLIHCHGARANMMGLYLKARFGYPTITTIHSDYRLDYMGNLRKQLTFGMINRFCLRHIDFYNCVADRTARLMISRGFSPSRIFTIYNSIDFDEIDRGIDKSAYLEKFGARYEAGDVLCGLVARLTPVKDVATLIRAGAAAIERGAPLKLMIAGDGEDALPLRELARELGIEERTVFTGWLDDPRDFYRVIDINVLSSLSETFPYVVLEGIESGCATVTSDVGGMPELITHGENGFIFPPKDFAALGGYLYDLSLDPELRKSFAEKLYASARDRFSLDKMAQTQHLIYTRALRRFELRGKRAGVVVCGSYGRGNAGDDAILRAIVNEMREIDPDMPLYVMSRRPRATALEYRVDTLFTFAVLNMFCKMRRAALYINGGGNLIQDITSNRSLYFYLFTLAAAKRLGARVMMYGCGIGPVSSPRNRRFTARILNSCVDTVTLREDDSKTELDLMGVTAPRIILTADPALTLSPAPESEIDAAFKESGIPPRGAYLALCVRNWRGFDEAIPAIAKAAEYARKYYGRDTVLLPIEMPRDGAAGDRLAAAMTRKPYIFRRRFPIETTIGILSRMESVLSLRLHALIFSARVGVPNAGIVYDNKVKGFMRYMKTDLYADLEGIDERTLCRFIDRMAETDRADLYENAERLRLLEHRNVEEARSLLGDLK